MIEGIHKDKFAELTLFRQQYLNSPLIHNMELVVKQFGKGFGEEWSTGYMYKDDKITICTDRLYHIQSVRIHASQGNSTLVFQDGYCHTPNTYAIIRDDPHDFRGNTYWTLTVDDVTYRPGKWIDYINTTLIAKVAAKKAAYEQARQELKIAEEQKRARFKATHNTPIDDSNIFP